MPVVLSTHEGKSSNGYQYDDETGIAYEYPQGRYERLIYPGQRFLYHSPGLGYSGVGAVGNVVSSSKVGHLICEILDYAPFESYVGLKDDAGNYFEADVENGKENVYWAQGVRPIRDVSFDEILKRSGTVPAGARSARQTRGGFPPKDVIDAVDRLAMQVALTEVATRFPTALVREMPHNNPGYDIRVEMKDAAHRFVEVKGTQSSEPWFFMSEGERRFSEMNESTYSLLVVTGIRLATQTFEALNWRDGCVDAHVEVLKPMQWSAKLGAMNCEEKT